MLPSATALSTQQLAEFLAVVSAVHDGLSATRIAVERAARALEAEVAAVLGDAGVASSVGFPLGRVPVAELAQVVGGDRWLLDVPGAGLCHTAVAPIAGRTPGHLLVARSGEDGFTVEEVSLLRGMARVLELTIGTLHTFEAERRQAAENERLLEELLERHRLLEELSKIQRAISRREPFQSILDAITAGARELLRDEVAGLRLRDPDDPGMMILHSNKGLHPDLAKELWRVAIQDAGATGQALLRDELAAAHIQSAMAAPVHDSGVVVCSLVVASYQPRVYTDRDRDVLQVFAEHVSLAVTDHQTREKMHEAYHDSLTGLASRALFMERLEHGLARAARQRTQL